MKAKQLTSNERAYSSIRTVNDTGWTTFLDMVEATPYEGLYDARVDGGNDVSAAPVLGARTGVRCFKFAVNLRGALTKISKHAYRLGPDILFRHLSLKWTGEDWSYLAKEQSLQLIDHSAGHHPKLTQLLSP